MIRQGFSLIELLLVLVIIMLLAALMFPAFSKAREGAIETDTLVRVRNIALATELYRQDHGGYTNIGHPFRDLMTPWGIESLEGYGIRDSSRFCRRDYASFNGHANAMYLQAFGWFIFPPSVEEEFSEWVEATQKHSGNVPYLLAACSNPPDHPFHTMLEVTKTHGIFLDGSVRTRHVSNPVMILDKWLTD